MLHLQVNDQLELFAFRCLCESMVEKNFLPCHPHAVANQGCDASAAHPFRYPGASRSKRLPSSLFCRPAAKTPRQWKTARAGRRPVSRQKSPVTYSKNAGCFLLSPRTKRKPAFGKTNPYPLDLADGILAATISYAADAAFRQVFWSGF